MIWSGKKWYTRKKNVCFCACVCVWVWGYVCVHVSLQVGVHMCTELQLLNTSIWWKRRLVLHWIWHNVGGCKFKAYTFECFSTGGERQWRFGWMTVVVVLLNSVSSLCSYCKWRFRNIIFPCRNAHKQQYYSTYTLSIQTECPTCKCINTHIRTHTHALPIIFSLFPLLVAKTAGSHVTVKGLYFLLPVIIIDGLVWIPLPSSTSNHHAHTHTSVLIRIQTSRLNSPYFLDRPRNRSFTQQVHKHWLTYVCWETYTCMHTRR